LSEVAGELIDIRQERTEITDQLGNLQMSRH